MEDKFVGTNIGVNLVSGNIKQKKKGVAVYISIVCFFGALIAFIITLIEAIIEINIGFIFISLLGIFCIGYMLLISGYMQPSKNYYIKVKDNKSFEGFELYYKDKCISLKYQVDNRGKFKWSNCNSLLECISYADGTHMSRFTKYKIMNYFSAWLEGNDYLSKDVTIPLEKL